MKTPAEDRIRTCSGMSAASIPSDYTGLLRHLHLQQEETKGPTPGRNGVGGGWPIEEDTTESKTPALDRYRLIRNSLPANAKGGDTGSAKSMGRASFRFNFDPVLIPTLFSHTSDNHSPRHGTRLADHKA
ncbi:hypothetical protein V2G26_020342 [Clonostachys chloroleuca]